MRANDTLLALGGAFAILPLFNRFLIWRASTNVCNRPGNNVRIKRSVTATDQGLHTEGHDGSFGFIPWGSVTRIVEGKSATLFTVPINAAIVVSRRAFGSEGDYQSFVAYAKERHRAQITKPVGD
ncbi:MAG TPA: YcxB family protein [Fimbriimonadaceae bacterium]|nr:YcxB family protein [Fimbriimonadaceae bacterium]